MKKEYKEKIARKWTPDFVIGSGSLILDHSRALSGFKGIPSGAIVQVSSDKEGSFKTSLCLQGASNIQKDLDKKIVFIDAEAGLTGLEWVENMGVLTDEDHWIYYQPETGEEALEVAEYFMKQDDVGGVIVDSIDACVPEKQLTGNLGDADMGTHAKLITRAVRRFRSIVRTEQCILWLVNQKKVNLTAMGAMGSKTTGGRGINFYSKLNIEMSRDKSPSALENKILIPLNISVKKSKFGDSFVKIKTFGRQGYGIDQNAELQKFAVEHNLITQSGSWWKEVDPETGEVLEGAIGQGLEPVTQWCKENRDRILKYLEDGNSKTTQNETSGEA